MARIGGALFLLVASVFFPVGDANGKGAPDTARLSQAALGDTFPVSLGYLEPYPQEILRKFPGLPTKHAGIDFQAPWGTPVRSVTGGEVIRVKNKYIDASGKPRTDGSPCYRGSVLVFDGKNTWLYGHMQNVDEKLLGQKIQTGKIIGTVSNVGCGEGNHLHVGVRPGRNPFDVGTARQSGPVEMATLNPAKQIESVPSVPLATLPPPSFKSPSCQAQPSVSKSLKVATPGTLIHERGWCFTPNATATLYFRRSDGFEFPPRKIQIGPDGTFSNFFRIPQNYPPGFYTFWAVDDTTQKRSGFFVYQVLPARPSRSSTFIPFLPRP